MTTHRFAVAISRFNPEVTEGLLAGALAEFAQRGAPVAQADVFEAPGAFELPLIAQALARTGRYAGIACLGCVIKGDTAHFEFISAGAAWGLVSAGLATETPIAFGVLTTYTDEQAAIRSRDDAGNKGREAAAACVEAAATLRVIRAAA
ncbi:6,7-dimethyl-8-ribityllumazine synthase [Caulobacter hibisci]|uniref:6,7-dimethyl-8-ribityllumazine synthase n=1 Tax=Caulobacter hibisci TaxID=2035993 RepID=A0ABS0T1K3_9CAUL|nr:6,7-dimethyl-8-ribityllumazine synthase [Caulobacter hibisci]MBI1685750.1 6,7-dimethyl-8-ribityllumazine synthase [Caulobacter hibisci]